MHLELLQKMFSHADFNSTSISDITLLMGQSKYIPREIFISEFLFECRRRNVIHRQLGANIRDHYIFPSIFRTQARVWTDFLPPSLSSKMRSTIDNEHSLRTFWWEPAISCFSLSVFHRCFTTTRALSFSSMDFRGSLFAPNKCFSWLIVVFWPKKV